MKDKKAPVSEESKKASGCELMKSWYAWIGQIWIDYDKNKTKPEVKNASKN